MLEKQNLTIHFFLVGNQHNYLIYRNILYIILIWMYARHFSHNTLIQADTQTDSVYLPNLGRYPDRFRVSPLMFDNLS